MDVLDYDKDVFMFHECYNDDGGSDAGARSSSFTFVSPIEGNVTIKYTLRFNDSKAPFRPRNQTNWGYMWINVNGVASYGRYDLGSVITNGQDHSQSGELTRRIYKGTNTITVYNPGVERGNHFMITGYHFSISTLVIKIKGQYLPLNI